MLADRSSALLLAERALALRSPYAKLMQSRQHVEHQEQTALRLIQGRLDKANARLSAAAEHLQALSPLAVLGRGYSMVQDGMGVPIPSVQRLTVGQCVTVRFADGQATAEIREIEANKETTHGR